MLEEGPFSASEPKTFIRKRTGENTNYTCKPDVETFTRPRTGEGTNYGCMPKFPLPDIPKKSEWKSVSYRSEATNGTSDGCSRSLSNEGPPVTPMYRGLNPQRRSKSESEKVASDAQVVEGRSSIVISQRTKKGV